jgi:DNA repair protein SbcD/Mre11
MNILHTSDWHLGKRLDVYDRLDEQRLALAWLRQTILDKNIEVLLVAGDVFDTATPPNEARKLYYHFLSSLLGTNCRHIVIVGGNHDSAAMLSADKTLLEALQIYVVGGALPQKTDEILLLRNMQNEVELIVAAVPFLQERDLRQTALTDTIESRFVAIQQGIKAHYDEIGEAVALLKATHKVPAIATGHLFARNATDEKEKGSRIYVGNLENIAAADFHTAFDYVALGHIHRAQSLLPHVRYSGSLIPLSFSEIKNQKSVTIVDFDTKKQVKIRSLLVGAGSGFRKLVQIKGSLAEIEAQIAALTPAETGLDSWVELIVETDVALPNLAYDLQTFIENRPVQILKFSVALTQNSTAGMHEFEGQTLENLDVEDVFLKRCESENISESEKITLRQTFLELLEL